MARYVVYFRVGSIETGSIEVEAESAEEARTKFLTGDIHVFPRDALVEWAETKLKERLALVNRDVREGEMTTSDRIVLWLILVGVYFLLGVSLKGVSL